MKKSFYILQKLFLNALLLLSICQSPILHASENLCSRDDLVLTHALIRTKKVANNQLFYYRLHLATQQKLAEKEYKLIGVNCCGQLTGRARLWVDKEETPWIDDGSKKMPLEEFEASFGNFLDGEFADFVIVDNEGSILAGTRIFPKPIKCKASDGAILSLQLRTKEGQYVLQGVGFKPKEVL